jgi:hypothetical protein
VNERLGFFIWRYEPAWQCSPQSAAPLRGLFFDVQPAGVSIAKHIAQISNLIGRQWIRTGLHQDLKGILNLLEIDLAEFVSTPD